MLSAITYSAAISACHMELLEGMQQMRQRAAASCYLHGSDLCMMVSLMTVSRPALLDSRQLWSMSIVQCIGCIHVYVCVRR